ncbi:MAG: hypothetical protein JRH20_04105 [Deltaproteobacteria bacterium]|nr:hypothetical protein [Deltaproteobacteria bacterium]
MMVRYLWTVLGPFALLSLAGCTPELGDAPFLCNTGSPQCPTGYTCLEGSNMCVPEGSCPLGVPGCEAIDASIVPESCGNATCEAEKGEDCLNCEEDCGLCVGCGDGTCDYQSDETCESCERDCGPCECGNQRCDVGEDKDSCPEDCATGPICGNGSCDSGETLTSCPQDCTPPPVCGDDACTGGETELTCPQDCKPTTGCGNGTCDEGESTTSCPQDCPAVCMSDGATRCIDASNIEGCYQGEWTAFTCAEVCEPAPSLGCVYVQEEQRDLCSCDLVEVGYGAVCGKAIGIVCAAGLHCVAPAGNYLEGVCTQTCTGAAGDCAGDPPGTSSYCSSTQTVDGDHICVFYCSSTLPCPEGLMCDGGYYSSGDCYVP